MSRMVKFLSIAVILFSLAASASWYLQYKQAAETEGAKSADEKGAKVGAPTKASGADVSGNRPLIRPPISGDADKMAQFSTTLQQQQEALKAREQQVVTREKQMDMIHVEIKKEQKKLDSVRKEIQTELQLVMEKLESLEKKTTEAGTIRAQLTRATEELEGKKTEMNGLESTNVKKLAAMYEKMEPEAGAQHFEQFVEKGKLDTAVLILSNMGQRQAAALLGEVSKQDPSIAVQLVDRMRFYKMPQISPK